MTPLFEILPNSTALAAILFFNMAAKAGILKLLT
jgi:hypothetical protein